MSKRHVNPLLGSSLETHTARPSSNFECATCHERLDGDYVQHKFLKGGPQGGRFSESYRYHRDCYDPPPAAAPSSGSGSAASSAALALVSPKGAFIAFAIAGVLLAGCTLYVWWQRKRVPA